MSKRTVRIGVVGVRNIGKGHIRRALALEAVEIRALADTDESRLNEAAEEFGVENRYTSAAKLFARDDLDGAVLAVPNHLHGALAIDAMRAGKHVLVEKPLAHTSEDAGRMIAARNETGCILMVGMNQRFSPIHYAAKNLLAKGAIGPVYYGKTCWNLRKPFEGLWGRSDWFLDDKLAGGGPLIDLGVHRLDLALHMMGFPSVRSVSGATFSRLGKLEADRRGKPYGIEDAGVGLIRFADGGALLLESSFFLNQVEENIRNTTLYGEQGTAVLGEEVRFYRFSGDETEEVAVQPDEDAPQSCVEHFCRVIRGEERLVSTAEQGLVSIEIIEGLYESARTGETVVLG